MLRTHNTLSSFNLPWWRFLLNMSFFLASFLLHVVVSIFMALAFARSLNRLTDVRETLCMHKCAVHASIKVDQPPSYISEAPSPFQISFPFHPRKCGR